MRPFRRELFGCASRAQKEHSTRPKISHNDVDATERERWRGLDAADDVAAEEAQEEEARPHERQAHDDVDRRDLAAQDRLRRAPSRENAAVS